MPGDEIRAERLVPGDPGALFEFLSDLESHWLLADGFIEVLELERGGPDGPARGARVKMRGPLGLRRIAVTRVLEVEPQSRLAGTAQIGPNYGVLGNVTSGLDVVQKIFSIPIAGGASDGPPAQPVYIHSVTIVTS